MLCSFSVCVSPEARRIAERHQLVAESEGTVFCQLGPPVDCMQALPSMARIYLVCSAVLECLRRGGTGHIRRHRCCQSVVQATQATPTAHGRSPFILWMNKTPPTHLAGEEGVA
jgi:hypothetical protein